MKIERVGIVGGGQMGAGIAEVAARAGASVIVMEVAAEFAERARARIASSLDRAIERGKLTEDERDATLGRLEFTTDLEEFADCDLAIEAVTEDEGLKAEIFRTLDRVVRSEEAILASNTSSIPITRLAATTGRPEHVVGMHFFNPVPVMALVEIIRGLRTSEETVDTVTRLAERLGKTPIGVKNSAGFVVNRILCPMINEAIFALQEGLATAAEIDAGMKLGCNHPIGPLALCDLIGLDVELAVMEVLYASFNDPKYRPAALLREMVDAGQLGRKTGRGFYDYAK